MNIVYRADVRAFDQVLILSELAGISIHGITP